MTYLKIKALIIILIMLFINILIKKSFIDYYRKVIQ